jgi:hypothetical protein
MNWIRENKFLTGYLVAVIVGTAVLLFFVFREKGKYETVVANYQQQERELIRLRNLDPYPEQQNVHTLEALKSEFEEKLTEVHKKLVVQEFPIEPMSPTEFQDRLRKAVAGVVAAAEAKNVELPKEFQLGFDEYKSALPRDEVAAAHLGRQLKAIEYITQQLIQASVASIGSVVRPKLPAEQGPPPAATGKAPPRGKAGAPAAQQTLVQRAPFEVTFTADEPKVRGVLDTITSTPKQFFVIRRVSLKNTNEKGPSRAEASPAPGAATPPPQPAADQGIAFPGANAAQPAQAQPAPASLHFIVGEEMVIAALRIEMLDFADQLPK